MQPRHASIRQTAPGLVPVRPRLPAWRVAVVLNRNARGVTGRVIDRVSRLLPASDLFLSSSLEESSHIASQVIERGYGAVLLGGGDGTFTQCVTDLRRAARRQDLPLPSVGVLRLGTGNALAWATEAADVSEIGLRRDLARARDSRRVERLPVLEVDEQLTPFAGVGLDAQIQQDFGAVTDLLDQVGVGRKLSAAVRYALAVGLRSTPRYLMSRLPEVVAINRGAPAQRVGAGGVFVGEPVGSGEVLYRGRCSMATGSTIPFFGLGMRMFPHAQRREDRFQLRCASMPTHEILGHLPALWRGDYSSPAIFDYLVDKVELRLERPVPLQIGGDLQPGLRDQVLLSLARPIVVIH